MSITRLPLEFWKKVNTLDEPRRTAAKALLYLVGAGLFFKLTSVKKNKKPRGGNPKKKGTKERSFVSRLRSICVILFKSKNGGMAPVAPLMVGLTVLLVARTLISIRVALYTGEVAQRLVQGSWPGFKSSVSKFAMLGLPAALVNACLRFCQTRVQLEFQKSLTEHINKVYVQGVNFYKANELPDTHIDNVAQRVTSDVDAFSSELASLYTSVFKPVLDVVLNTVTLHQMMGMKAPVITFSYYIILARIKMIILRVIDLKKNTQRQSALQGEYRTAHQRLITYSEEIAFFEGADRERSIIQSLFKNMYGHSNFVAKLHLMIGIIDQYLIKYGASIMGYGLLCIPVFFPSVTAKRTVSDNTRDYVRNRQLLMDLAGGIGTLLSTTTTVASFAGITARVSEVLESISKLNESGSQKFTVRDDTQSVPGNTDNNGNVKKEEEKDDSVMDQLSEDDFLALWKRKGEELRATGKRPKWAKNTAKNPDVIEGDIVQFQHLTIVAPDGRLLCSDLHLDVPHGRNIMITGPNGCGKSSCFRVLGELWPPYKGKVIKPAKEDIVFVPQKPYLVMGTLRDQIIYPHTKEEMLSLDIVDEDLVKLLDVVDPARSIVKSWKFDDVRQWFNAFSGGQKQRVAMARVLYHRPRYAILDECTSAVSYEVEGKIYMTCRKLGVTLFTISHRPNLQQYHDYQLKFDGHGGYEFKTSHEAEEEHASRIAQEEKA